MKKTKLIMEHLRAIVTTAPVYGAVVTHIYKDAPKVEVLLLPLFQYIDIVYTHTPHDSVRYARDILPHITPLVRGEKVPIVDETTPHGYLPSYWKWSANPELGIHPTLSSAPALKSIGEGLLVPSSLVDIPEWDEVSSLGQISLNYAVGKYGTREVYGIRGYRNGDEVVFILWALVGWDEALDVLSPQNVQRLVKEEWPRFPQFFQPENWENIKASFFHI